MTQLANGADANMAVLAVHNMKRLARETFTDVEGVVAWLQSSCNPVDAMQKLLEQPQDMHNDGADTSRVNDFWVS